jgi:hypothetical protein
MSRALRRHHRERLKKARRYYHLGLWPEYRPIDPKIVAKWIDTPCPCSCTGCGNQRHAWGRKIRTIQEMRFFATSLSD